MRTRLEARSVVAAVLVAAAWPALVCLGDEPTNKPQYIGGLAFRDEIELTIVNITVNVTDNDGQPVTDLSADEFEVMQDGKERQITNFRLYTTEVYRQYSQPEAAPDVPVAGPPGPAEDIELQPVWIVLFVDHQNINPIQRNRILNQTRTFVRENVNPPVQMMVVSRQQSPKVVLDFTSDSGSVLEALRSLRLETGGRPSVERDRNEIIQTIQSREYNPSNLNDPQLVISRIRSFAREQTNNVLFTLQSLREIMSMLAGLEGKKAIVYVSNGLPLIPGIGLFHAYAAAFNDSNAYSEATSYKQTQAYESLAAAANAQGVTLYTMDVGGLRMPGAANAEYRDSEDHKAATVGHQNELDSLRFLADETGGIAIVDTNDVSPWLERVEHDFFTYYSIGYPMQQAGADKVHEIKVRLPDHPQYNVRYRRVFAEKSLETRVQEKVVSSLVLPVDENPMDIELTAGRAAPAVEDRWTLPISVSIPTEAVALMPEGDDFVARVVLFVAVRDDDGGQSETVRQVRELRLPAAAVDEAKGRRFTLDASLLMREGRHAVAVGVLDQVTRQSSIETLTTSVPQG